MPNIENMSKVLVSLMPQQNEMLERMIEKMGYSSRSDAIRQAIRAHYQQIFPAYREIHERKESEKQKIENMTNEEYVEYEFAGLPYEMVNSADGKEVLFVSPKNPAFRMSFELAKIKNFTRNDLGW